MENIRIKVFYIITGLELGGAEIVLLNILKNINKDLFDCSLMYLKGKPDIEDDFKKINIKIYDNAKYSFINPYKYYHIYKVLKESNVDILHTHLIHSNLIGRVIGRLAGIRRIINSEHNTSNWSLANPFMLFFYKITLKKVDIIHCISYSVKSKLIKSITVDEKKIKIIYNGIKINSKRYVNNKQNAIAAHPILGTVSRLDKRKGLEYLVSAIKILQGRYSKIQLFIVGDGPEKFALSSLVEKLNLNENVVFIGKTFDTEKYYRLFDIFILPSLQEGLSIAIIEAMSYGIPVIASNIDGIPEVVTHMEDGILVPSKSDSRIAESVEEIIQNSELRSKLINNAYKKIQERFDIKKVVNEFETIYQDLKFN